MTEKRFGLCVVLAFGLHTSSALAQTTVSQTTPARPHPVKAAGRQPLTSEHQQTLPGGITLRMAAGTVIQTLRPTRLQLGPPGTPNTLTHVFQLVQGRVSVSVPRGPNPPTTAVLVRAPRRASAVIKAGTGVVIASPKAVTVGAIEGEMLAALGDDWKPLSQGSARSFDDHDAAGKRRNIVPAARLAVVEPLVLAMGNNTASTRFSWGRVEGASSYRVSVSKVDAAGSTPRTLETTEPSARVDDLGPARYRMAVTAVDSYGLDGPASTFETKVVGVELPPGARQVKDAIELGPRQRVRLSDPTGLELSYDKASLFVRAPKEIGLARGEMTIVRLREAGRRDEFKLRLVPRDTHAHITIGPSLAHWPSDPISIKIAFRDGKGRPLPEAPSVHTDVRVNIDPVPVTWKRHGGTFEGAVAPRADKGPWVVRVQVKDEFGDEIGWSFLEVARREEVVRPGSVTHRGDIARR